MVFKFFFLILIFTGCSAFNNHGSNPPLSLGLACEEDLRAIFQQTYQPFLVNNCNSCHSVGGPGRGSFADDDLDTAFDEFLLRGPDLVGERAVDPNHRPPFSGPHLSDEEANLRTQWDSLSAQTSCQSVDADDNDLSDDPLPEGGQFKTTEQVLSLDPSNQTLLWNLERDIVLPENTSYSGAQLSVDIQVMTSDTGETSYLFSQPILTAGDSALHIAFVEIYINGELINSASTFRGINRYIPSNDTRELTETTMVVPFNISDQDRVGMAFGILEPVDFEPYTFTELTSELFLNNCTSCHSGDNPRGGLDITNLSRLQGEGLVIPFSEKTSEIYKRMVDTTNPMPPSGLLPAEETKKVRDWILDGAPE